MRSSWTLRARPAPGLQSAPAANDRGVRSIAKRDALVLCTEAPTAGELDEIAAALTRVWQHSERSLSE